MFDRKRKQQSLRGSGKKQRMQLKPGRLKIGLSDKRRRKGRRRSHQRKVMGRMLHKKLR